MHGLMDTDKFKYVYVALREKPNLFLKYVDLNSVSGTFLSCCITLLEINDHMLIFAGN